MGRPGRPNAPRERRGAAVRREAVLGRRTAKEKCCAWLVIPAALAFLKALGEAESNPIEMAMRP